MIECMIMEYLDVVSMVFVWVFSVIVVLWLLRGGGLSLLSLFVMLMCFIVICG